MPGGALLVATGSDAEQRATVPWRAVVAADETNRSWSAFFDQLEGEPEWIVADRASAIWKAAAARWPNAVRFACAWHLAKNLTEAAYRDGVFHAGTHFAPAIRSAFHSQADWIALADLAEQHRALNVLSWMVDNEALIERQIVLREQFPDRPRSNGAAERAVAQIDQRLGRRRRNFRNAARLNTVVGLMTVDLRGAADPLTFTRLVREAIAGSHAPRLHDGDGMDRGAMVNDPDAPAAGSIATLLLTGKLSRQTANRRYWVDAKTSSVQRHADTLNAERVRQGLPLIEVRISKGGVAAVPVRGKLLTEFPEFAAEWAADLNGRGPADIKAGSAASKVWWRCRAGHTWQTTVADRLVRLLRCERCATKRADATTSLAAVHPGLLASWNGVGNLPLKPESIKSTYQRTVSWLCLAGLNHPPYRASIAKRRKDAIPCPLCRRMRSARPGRTRAAGG